MKKKFLPVTRDIMFKNLYGRQENARYTEDLLESLYDIPPGSLEGLVIRNSVKLDKETVENKHFEMDILVDLPSGEEIVLEIQTIYDIEAEIKNVMYITGSIYKSLKSGESYKKAKKVSGLMFIKNMEIKRRKGKKVIENYYITSENDIKDKVLPGLYKLTLVKLEHNCEYLEDNVPKRFKRYMKFLNAQTLEELKEATKDDEVLIGAYKECERFMDLEYVQSFENDEKVLRGRVERHIEEALNRGINQGINKGINQGEKTKAKKMAIKMLKSSKDIDEIIEFTELSKKELYKLIKVDPELRKVYSNYESLKQI